MAPLSNNEDGTEIINTMRQHHHHHQDQNGDDDDCSSNNPMDCDEPRIVSFSSSPPVSPASIKKTTVSIKSSLKRTVSDEESSTYSSSSSSNCSMSDASSTSSSSRSINNNKDQKKSVQFAVFSAQYSIPNRDEYTDEERTNSYFSKHDYQRIQQDIRNTVSKMNEGHFPDTDNDDDGYFRGLENWMDDYCVERKELVSMTVSCILRVQRKPFGIDPVWVERVYQRYTARSMIFATRAGNFDATQAAAVFQTSTASSSADPTSANINTAVLSATV